MAIINNQDNQDNQEIINADNFIANTYKRFPIVLESGKGVKLFDKFGNEYLDFVAGIAVCNLGHCHDELIAVIYKQSQKLWHVSNLYYTIPQINLAKFLINNSFGDKVFFCNSGAEANEAAIKLARKYFKDKNQPEKFKIIAMQKSFHGRTMGALSATGQDKIKIGFEPILPGFDFVEFNNLEALKSKIDANICAIMLELVQGEGGVKAINSEYLKQVRKLCDELDILLIFDEIQTGMGRTGKLFCYEHFDIIPDIMTLAKGLANGLPIGAMITKEHVAQAFKYGSHASTFGGTPIITSVALKVLEILTQNKIIENSVEIGKYFKEKLIWLKNKYNIIKEVRGLGLLLGIELEINGQEFVNKALRENILINCVQDKVLRFVPPLIVQKQDIDKLIICLDKIFREI